MNEKDVRILNELVPDEQVKVAAQGVGYVYVREELSRVYSNMSALLSEYSIETESVKDSITTAMSYIDTAMHDLRDPKF